MIIRLGENLIRKKIIRSLKGICSSCGSRTTDFNCVDIRFPKLLNFCKKTKKPEYSSVFKLYECFECYKKNEEKGKDIRQTMEDKL
jgi:hypothetical protein